MTEELPGRSKREGFSINERRTRVIELYLRRWRQVNIARELGVDKSTVTRDLQAIHQEWREERIDAFDEKVARELASIDQLEREYWQAWERSCAERKSKATSTSRDGRKDSVRGYIKTEDRDGNPTFLSGVQWCIEQRCRILGLYAPSKLAPTTPDGKEQYCGLSDTERLERLARLFDAVRARVARTAGDAEPASG